MYNAFACFEQQCMMKCCEHKTTKLKQSRVPQLNSCEHVYVWEDQNLAVTDARDYEVLNLYK